MNEVNLQVKVEEAQYTAFKIMCLKNRDSVKQAISDLLQYYIDNPKMTSNESEN